MRTELETQVLLEADTEAVWVTKGILTLRDGTEIDFNDQALLPLELVAALHALCHARAGFAVVELADRPANRELLEAVEAWRYALEAVAATPADDDVVFLPDTPGNRDLRQAVESWFYGEEDAAAIAFGAAVLGYGTKFPGLVAVSKEAITEYLRLVDAAACGGGEQP